MRKILVLLMVLVAAPVSAQTEVTEYVDRFIEDAPQSLLDSVLRHCAGDRDCHTQSALVGGFLLETIERGPTQREIIEDHCVPRAHGNMESASRCYEDQVKAFGEWGEIIERQTVERVFDRVKACGRWRPDFERTARCARIADRQQ